MTATRLGAFALIVAGATAVVRAATVPMTSGDRMDSARLSASASPPRSGDPAPDSLVARAFERPLFRPSRRPATRGFDPSAGAQAAAEPAAPPVERPALQLSGIVWGAEPTAIVEGLPGAESSTVLRRGEAASGIRLTRIERTRVTLVGRDTVWILKVREPWR